MPRRLCRARHGNRRKRRRGTLASRAETKSRLVRYGIAAAFAATSDFSWPSVKE